MIDGRGHCAQCGAVLDIPPDQTPDVVLKTAPGELIMRTLNIDGREVHRCTIAALHAPMRPPDRPLRPKSPQTSEQT